MIADISSPAFHAEWMPCKLLDANGVEITEAVWADTDTGEVVRLRRDADRSFVITVDEEGELVVAKDWETHPAPLRLVRIGPHETKERE